MTDAKAKERAPDAALGKDECFVIQGKEAKGTRTLWIDKKSFLLRRIDAYHDFGDFKTESMTSYAAVADGDVDKEQLEFNPPKK